MAGTYYDAQVVMQSNTLIADYLNALSTRPAAALLATPTCCLYTGAPVLTPGMALSVLTALEATFTGYAAQALGTLVGPVNLPNNVQGLIFNVTFLCTASPGQNITGYFIRDGGSTILYAAEAFPTPIPLAASGDFLNLGLVFPLQTPLAV